LAEKDLPDRKESTDAEIERLRSMTTEERVAIGRRLNEEARETGVTAIRNQFPNFPEAKIESIFRGRLMLATLSKAT
jgi:hypothetical protein